ncbi:hypothetical protein K438DRAFT_473587 [Mycena galopus ATCC 62051]|nr:hypothetical protein K438DRAFT_473587 [Mycena galopus ATCC 62051]
MQELNVPNHPACDNLFLERLDAFCLAEIKAFAEREHRPLEEVCHLKLGFHILFVLIYYTRRPGNTSLNGIVNTYFSPKFRRLLPLLRTARREVCRLKCRRIILMGICSPC